MLCDAYGELTWAFQDMSWKARKALSRSLSPRNHFRRSTYCLFITHSLLSAACINQIALTYLYTAPQTARSWHHYFASNDIIRISSPIISFRLQPYQKPLRRLTTAFSPYITLNTNTTRLHYPSFEKNRRHLQSSSSSSSSSTPYLHSSSSERHLEFTFIFIHIHRISSLYSHTKSSLIPFA